MAFEPDESAIDSSVFDDFREPGEERGANEFVISLIDEYLSDSAARMRAMKEAVARLDGPGVRLGAHSLRGSSGTIGARKMAAICADLEALAHDSVFDPMPALFTTLEAEFVRVGHALRAEQRTTP